jgi:RNA polymerase sigma-70 factor (ECF subfamily)
MWRALVLGRVHGPAILERCVFSNLQVMTSFHQFNKAYDSLTDEELMLKAAKRDKEAFSLLVLRNQEKLVNFFRKMGDYSSAEDLAQETFVRLYNYREKYEPKARFKTFLFLMARYRWIDHCRHLDRKKKAADILEQDSDLIHPPAKEELKEIHVKAVEALDKLSDEMKEVVVLNIYQGLKYAEIAEVLEIPVGTVKSRMFKAMAKLQEFLKHESR